MRDQIIEMKIYLNVLWLGPHFRTELFRLYTNYMSGSSDKRPLFVHWTPSDVIDYKYEFEHITMPMCEDLYSLRRSYCKYELTAVIKYYVQSVSKDERLLAALRYFWIDITHLENLFNEVNLRRTPNDTALMIDEIYNNVSCNWLRQNAPLYKKWIVPETMTISVGGIFPIVEDNRGHQNLVQAVRRAAIAIDRSQNILSNYTFRVLENDGECKTDIVMRTLIHYFNDPEVVGILGPACSETVEPIAGISRHINMPVISYSAEGASFVDRETYPYFFRTIGSNRQYEDFYISLMKEFRWKRVAALTEDGQRYAEYISHMESVLKTNNFELIANKKFLSDVNPQQMSKASKKFTHLL